jgi:DNA replication protein DnaC
MEPCACWKGESEAERRGRLLRYSHLGALARFNFESLTPEGRRSDPEDQRLFRQAVSAAHAFAENPSGWLVLTGPSGCGKTHLAAALAWHAIEVGHPALFMAAPDLLDHLRATFAPRAEVSYDLLFEQVRNAPLLVLDDLGAHASTPWAQEKLFQVLNHRRNLLLPTVAVLAVPLEALEERWQTRLTDPSLVRLLPLATDRPLTGEGIGAVPTPLREEMTFDHFDLRGNKAGARERDNLTMALRTAQNYATNPAGLWLILVGSPGVGKTHLAVAIINERLRPGEPAFYARVPDLLDYLRATYAPSSPVSYDQRFEQIRSAPFLVLDDLGSQKTSPWAEEKLHQLLVHRHDARLPTVITVRSSVELDPAISSRLKDARFVTAIEIEAPDHRDQAPRDQAPRPRGGRGSPPPR